jgi:hypothetical protein
MQLTGPLRPYDATEGLIWLSLDNIHSAIETYI